MEMTFDNPTEQFNFKGKFMTLEDLAKDNCEGDIEEAREIAKALYQRGSIKPIVAQKSPQERAIEHAMKESEIHNMVESYDDQQQALKIRKLEDKVQGCNIHKRVDLEFPDMYKAQVAEQEISTKFGIEETEVSVKKGVVYLVLRNVPDRVLVMISRQYTTDRAIEVGLNMLSTGVDKASGAVEYTATRIAAPAMQIAAKGGVSLLRSLFKVATKTGATLVTAGSQGIKQTASEIKHDPDIIRARNEIMTAKDGLARTMLVGNAGSAGIRIVDED